MDLELDLPYKYNQNDALNTQTRIYAPLGQGMTGESLRIDWREKGIFYFLGNEGEESGVSLWDA